MTRAVVVGPYPPAADPATAITLAEVRALRADGHDVLVISPASSAAPVAADPRTRRGARHIRRLLRGADLVVWVGPEPAGAASRALHDAADVRVRRTAPPPARSRGVLRPALDAAELLRAGTPTFVRSLPCRRRGR
jgi:hypothetical protein